MKIYTQNKSPRNPQPRANANSVSSLRWFSVYISVSVCSQCFIILMTPQYSLLHHKLSIQPQSLAVDRCQDLVAKALQWASLQVKPCPSPWCLPKSESPEGSCRSKGRYILKRICSTLQNALEKYVPNYAVICVVWECTFPRTPASQVDLLERLLSYTHSRYMCV